MARRSQDEINTADSVCDPNGRWVTAYSCQTGMIGQWGCMTVDGGQVPQPFSSSGDFMIEGHVAGTSPVTIGGVSYQHQPTFWLITSVQPSQPSMLGNQDSATINLPGNTACGFECDPNGCYWTGLPTATYQTWNVCNAAVTSGICNPQVNPTHYCDDYNCREIIYGGGPLVGDQISDTAAFSQIQANTTTSPANLAAGSPVIFPYSDPGGVWDGFTTLAEMASTPGPNGLGIIPGQPPAYYNYSYTPLHYNVDDCINCCGGVSVQSYSNGSPNPYYGIASNSTTAGNVLYQAWLNSGVTYTGSSSTSSSWTFRNYMWMNFGINSCGFDYRCGLSCP